MPASFAQRRMWFVDQLRPGSCSYNDWQVRRLVGPLDRDALRAALRYLVQRHESLRTTFDRDPDGEPVQVVHLAGYDPLTVVHVLGASAGARFERARERCAAAVAEPFDLGSGPLFRALLVALGPDDHLLALSAHHCVVDAWSWRTIFGELAACYTELRSGRSPQLDPLRYQYADFAAWQRSRLAGGRMRRAVSYWREHLTGVPGVLELPCDRPRSALGSAHGSRLEVPLAARLAVAAQTLAGSSGVTLFMVLLAVYAELLHRYSGQDQVVVGTPVAGRDRPELEPVVGCFVNTLPLRLDLSGDPSFAELLARVRDTALDAFNHQELPFEKIVELLGLERDPARTPLVQAMFTFQQGAATEGTEVAGLRMEPVSLVTDRVRLDLTLLGWARAGHVALALEYNTEVFDAPAARRFLEHFEALLAAAVAAPDRPLRQLTCGTPADDRLLEAVNRTAVAVPQTCGHDLVEAAVRRYPNAVAVECGLVRWSYAELDARANRLAHLLVRQGLAPGTVVGIHLGRSAELVVALLAVWKAGGAYLPLDPAHPGDRIRYLLADSGARMVITGEQLRDGLSAMLPDPAALSGPTVPVVCVEEAFAEPALRPDVHTQPDHLAYLIYTSGSTGWPKGVLVEHGGLPNVASAQARLLDIGPGDRVAQLAPLSFDASLFEIVLALAHGATLVLPPEVPPLVGETLGELLEAAAISHLVIVPSALAHLPGGDYPALRVICVAGEECPRSLAARWSAGGRLRNLYGPTETTIWATAARLDPADERTPSIGLPIDNTEVYVLDDRLGRVPVGVPGELYLGGLSLARGYAGKPALTAERFVPHPFTGRSGGRLYRTGDRVRLRSDATLEFLGRVDEQVKVRGVRIEPAEVQAALDLHRAVRQSVVIARDDPSAGKQLIAYVVPEPGHTATADELATHLRRMLPPHLLPAGFVCLDGLPRNGSGKVDRTALPAPAGRDVASPTPYRPPQGPVETVLAEVFASILRIDSVGATDNFFQIGGDSLACVRVAVAARARGLDVSTADVFLHQTVAALADAVGQRSSAAGTGPPAPARLAAPEARLLLEHEPSAEEAYPLTAYQRFALDRYLQAGDPAAYLVVSSYRTRGTVWDPDAFAAAWTAVAMRHSALRTGFRWQGLHQPLQVVQASVQVPVEFHDWSRLPARDARQRVAGLLRREWETGLDPTGAPLMRAMLVRLGADDHVLVWTRQHLVMDGWSRSLVLADFFAAYDAALGREPRTPLGRSDFRELIDWTGAQDGPAADRFWRAQLGGFRPTPLGPAEPAEPAGGGLAGGCAARIASTIPPQQRAALEGIVARHSLTLYETLRGSLALALSHLLGTPDVLFGELTSGRTDGPPGIDTLVGNALRMVPSRFTTEGATPWYRWVGGHRAEQLERQRFGFVPLHRIAQAAGLDPDPELFDCYLVYEQHPTSAPVDQRTASWEVVAPIVPVTAVAYRLEILAGDSIVLSCVHDRGAGRADRATELVATWRRALDVIVAEPAATLDRVMAALATAASSGGRP